MTDVYSKKKRSWIMSQVRDRDTEPELLVRSLIHGMGYRFRLHVRDLPGNPDIVLPRHEKVVFVHGCFWHGHKGCKRAARPSANKKFWEKKLSGNVERDKKKVRELRKLGWKVLVVWQCELRNLDKLTAKLERFLVETRPSKRSRRATR
jgi:DNA mismatch endonuclease (patch repair protein)